MSDDVKVDRVAMIGDELPAEVKRLDWTEAVAYAIDAFDAGLRSRNPARLAAHGPVLWHTLRNTGAAHRAFLWLLEHEPVQSR